MKRISIILAGLFAAARASAELAVAETVDTEAVTKAEMETVHAAPAPAAPAAAVPEKVWTHFTFYADGSISRQPREVVAPDVLFDVPLSVAAKNKSARLLLCYDNGCVNIVNPKDVYSQKLKNSRQRYKNGWNTDAKLLRVYECGDDDYLVVRSRDPQGEPMIKAVHIGNYAVHTGLSMQTQGNRIVDPERAAVTDMEIVPGNQQSFIYPVILKSKNSVPGYPAMNFKYQDVMTFLKHRKAAATGDARA